MAATAAFGGQDNRASNITVDGSYFNGTFGLDTTTGGPGDRTGVAPISLEAIEQVQVSVAPYDVRQGNFVGANVNSVTRSGANQFAGSFYTRYRNESFVGTEARDPAVQSRNLQDDRLPASGSGGPIVKNKLFFFESFENQKDTRPLTTFTSNPGGAPVAGNTTRVLASDLTALSNYLETNFNYDTGPFDNIPNVTPGKPWLIKGNYNINNSQQGHLPVQPADRAPTVNHQSGSSSLGTGRPTVTTNFLTFAELELLDSREHQVGRRRVDSVFGTFTNNLHRRRHLQQREPRARFSSSRSS